MKKILLYLLLFTSTWGCSRNEENNRAPDGSVYTKNFIQSYVIPSEISLSHPKEMYIAVNISGVVIRNTETRTKEEYDNLATKNNDVSYNAYLSRNSTQALGAELTGINMICNKAIDENHKAGQSLNDIVKICAISFKEYINNNYSNAMKSASRPAEFSELLLYNGKGNCPVFKLLSEVAEADIAIIEPGFYLLLTKKPTPGEYEFTITVNSNNTNLIKNITVDF